MSHFDFIAARQITAQDHPFDALIMAAMQKADSRNAGRLRLAFPDVWDELQARYDAPGGVLVTDHVAVTP